MVQVGYPDYERISTQSGNLLASGSQVFSTTKIVFQGYVGNWPYLNLFFNGGGGTGFYNVAWVYYLDDTFSQIVAEASSARGDLTTSYVQKTPLSPWLVIFIEPAPYNGGAAAQYALYGTTGKGDSSKLGVAAGPLFEQQQSIGANSLTFFPAVIVQPCLATMSLCAQVATSGFLIQRYDISSQAFVTCFFIIGTVNDYSVVTPIMLPDAPIQVGLQNRTAAAGTLSAYIIAGTD